MASLTQPPSRRAWQLAAGVLALGLLTGCGGFSSGAAPGLEPPPPPDFASPENQGELSGKVVIAEALLAELAARARAREDGETAGAADLYREVRVRIEGTRRTRELPLEGDGSFVVDKLPEGAYRVRLQVEAAELDPVQVPIVAKETTQARIRILGRDLADLDRDGSRQDLLLESEVQPGGPGRPVRLVQADGTVRARLPNGGIEYLLAGGVVRREQPGRGATFRADHDLDGVADGDDPDWLRLRVKPPAPKAEDLLLGRAFPPLIRAASATAPDAAGPRGDLMLFEAELARDFAAPAAKVTVTLHSPDGPPYTLDLEDDGSQVDLLPDWPGHQPSGDRLAGDGRFAHLLPVDRTTHALLDGRLVVVEAQDAAGAASNKVAFYLDRRPSEPGSAGLVPGDADGWKTLRGVEFLGRQGRGGPELTARFEASSQLAGLVATLVGPRGFRRVFAPAEEPGSAGWLRFRTLPAPLTGDGNYYIVLGVPEGRIFYAGSALTAESIASSRTGG